jgi:hypothetical protein
MTSRSPDAAANRRPVLRSAELLSMTLIANLATLDEDGGIHLLSMWFLRIGNDIAFRPLAAHTSTETSWPDHARL